MAATAGDCIVDGVLAMELLAGCRRSSLAEGQCQLATLSGFAVHS